MPRRIVRIRSLVATAAALGLLVTQAPPARAAASVTGAGSTFAAIAIDRWRADAARALGIEVNYKGGGSTSGRTLFRQRTVDWASSDISFEPSEQPVGRPFTYIPLVAGGTALMHNLLDGAGRPINDLQLSGPTIAKLFAGEIRYWNDPQIKADNPNLAARLPGTVVRPIVRSGGSGTTAVFTAYWCHVAPDVWARFAAKYPIQSSGGCFTSNFPASETSNYTQGFSTSDGVANAIARKDPGAAGAIGYAEAGYALQQNLTMARVRNQAGLWTLPTARAVAIALTQAQRNPDGTQNLSRVYGHTHPESYAISSYNYAIVPGDIDPAKGNTLGKFMIYSITEGQAKAASLGYSPLPPNLVQQGLDNIKFIPGAPPAPPLGNWGRFYEELSVDPTSGGGKPQTAAGPARGGGPAARSSGPGVTGPGTVGGASIPGLTPAAAAASAQSATAARLRLLDELDPAKNPGGVLGSAKGAALLLLAGLALVLLVFLPPAFAATPLARVLGLVHRPSWWPLGRQH